MQGTTSAREASTRSEAQNGSEDPAAAREAPIRSEAQDGSDNPAAAREASTRSTPQKGNENTADAVRQRPAAATSTPMRQRPNKKNRTPAPGIPTETPPKKPRLSADANGKPMMPIEGEQVHYRGATVDMCCQSRDYYWRIKFPRGPVKYRDKALVFMCVYIYIYIFVSTYNRILYKYAYDGDDDDNYDDGDGDDDGNHHDCVDRDNTDLQLINHYNLCYLS